jgi:cytochrome c oxidase cbb3-type subunit 3
MSNKIIAALIIALLGSMHVSAQGTPGGPAAVPASAYMNPAFLLLVGVALVFIFLIAGLGYVLISVSELHLHKKEDKSIPAFPKSGFMIMAFLGISSLAQAQKTVAEAVVDSAPKASAIAGMTPTAFYLLLTTIIIEVFVIFGLLWNIWRIVKKSAPQTEVSVVKQKEARRFRLNWWEKLNSFKPMAQEADLDLGHDYDGIRELNNRLPPWWLYGFYVTIIFAGVYLWRYHVSHSAPSGKEEYEISVAEAEEKIHAYLAAKGEAVDENTVTLMTAKTDLDAGKEIFVKSCASCHLEDGGGLVGPNLTDNFWLHGGNIKNVFKTIRYGINAMPQWQNTYSNKQIAQVASYVKSLHGTTPKTAKPPQGVEETDNSPASTTDSSGTDKTN